MENSRKGSGGVVRIKRHRRTQTSLEIYVNSFKKTQFCLTALFLSLILFSWVITFRRGELLNLLCATVAMGAFIMGIRVFAGFFGSWASPRFFPGHPMKRKQRLNKFIDQTWQLVVHALFTVWEAYILSSETWFTDTSTVWKPIWYEQEVRASLKWLYLAQISVWTVTGISHRFIDEYHKDYYLMFAHHIATMILLVPSYHHNYVRIGLLVLFVHDAPDVVIDLLKLSFICKLDGKKGFFITEITFFLNFFTWFYFRLFLFPVKVIYSAFYESAVNSGQSFWDGVHTLQSYWLMQISLIFLLCLHVWWYWLFIRILRNIIKGTDGQKTAEEEYEGSEASEEE